MANKRVGGLIFLKANGVQFKAKGDFSYNINDNLKEQVVGSDGPHGFKYTPQELFIEGMITDSDDLDLKADLFAIEDATVTLELNNGKTIVLEEATFTGDGNVSTGEGEVNVKFSGMRAREV